MNTHTNTIYRHVHAQDNETKRETENNSSVSRHQDYYFNSHKHRGQSMVLSLRARAWTPCTKHPISTSQPFLTACPENLVSVANLDAFLLLLVHSVSVVYCPWSCCVDIRALRPHAPKSEQEISSAERTSRLDDSSDW